MESSQVAVESGHKLPSCLDFGQKECGVAASDEYDLEKRVKKMDSSPREMSQSGQSCCLEQPGSGGHARGKK
jgi:hypothetical protein